MGGFVKQAGNFGCDMVLVLNCKTITGYQVFCAMIVLNITRFFISHWDMHAAFVSLLRLVIIND